MAFPTLGAEWGKNPGLSSRFWVQDTYTVMLVYGLFTVIHCIQFSICFCLQFPNLFPVLSFPSFQLLLTRVSLAHLHLEWNYQSRSWLSPFKNSFISSTTAFGSFPFPSFSSTPLLSWILRFSILLSTLANIFPSHQVFSWHGPLIGLSLLCPVIPVEAINTSKRGIFQALDLIPGCHKPLIILWGKP